MKFVHAADVHLDSPLRGLQHYEGAPVEELRGATRRALTNLVDLALEEEAAFLLLAGDLFDDDWKDFSTGLFFVKEMNRLMAGGVPVIWVAGNHDSVSQVTKSLTLPEQVRQLAHKKAETHVLEELGVAIHGQSFATRAVDRDLACDFPAKRTGYFNIGLLHTSVNGREGHDTYAPCTINTLREKGYEYWALGHVHTREVLCEEPWVVFPGNIQGRNIRETGSKGCTLVTVDGRDVQSVEHRPLDVLRWEEVVVKAPANGQGRHVVDAFEKLLKTVHEHHEGMPLAVRVRVVGRSNAHRALLSSPERWAAEIRNCANSCDGVWVEKVKFDTASVEENVLPEIEGPLSALLSALDGLEPDSDVVAELKEDVRDLLAKVPELKDQDDFVDLEKPEDVAQLAESVKQMLLAQLSGEGEAE